MPKRRCSGLLTKNKPPNDQKACPPTLARFSWSRISTHRPRSANSQAATRPANPAPTTMASAVSPSASEPATASLMSVQVNATDQALGQAASSTAASARHRYTIGVHPCSIARSTASSIACSGPDLRK